MKRIVSILLLTISVAAAGQEFTLPDSAAVVRNKVKVVSIFFITDHGTRYQQKFLEYDKTGRVIKEAQDQSSYYYEYEYDSIGRRIASTQRSATGEFIQRFTDEFDDKAGCRKTKLFGNDDTEHPTHVYVYDSKNRKIAEEHYFKANLQYLNRITYDDANNVIASYDSSCAARTASWRDHGKLIKQRTYDPHGNLLHEFKYTYDYFGRPWKMTDSTGIMKTVAYENVYPKNGGPREGTKRDGTLMNANEEMNFRKEHPEMYPFIDEWREDYGLPVPEMITEHEITRDKKGNIVRDLVKQEQGSMSQSYEYVYVYEYF